MATVYQTKNGTQTTDTMAQQLASVGYNGPTDPSSIAEAYARTTGGAVTIGGGEGGTNPQPGQTGTTPGAAPQPAAPGGMSEADPAALAQYYNASSGCDYAQLGQNNQQFMASLDLQRQQMERIGIPQVQIQQQLATMEDEHFKQQMALATQAQNFNQGISQAQVTGYYSAPGGGAT